MTNITLAKPPPLPTSPPPPVPPAAAYVAGRASVVSRAGARAALSAMARLISPGADPLTLPWHLLRHEHTAWLRAELMQRYAPGTARTYLSTLRAVLHECAQLGLMTYEELHAATDWRRVVGSRLPPGRMITEEEEARLFARCAKLKTPHRERDAAMLAVGLSTGLRREEIAKAALDKLEGSKLTVIGKGGKERSVFIPEQALAVVGLWLKVRGATAGALFTPFSQRKPARPVFDRHLSPGSVWRILRDIRELTGVGFTPHDLRRTCISRMWAAGVPGPIIQKNAGHSDLSTTAKYSRLGDEKLMEATAKTDVGGATPRRISRVEVERVHKYMLLGGISRDEGEQAFASFMHGFGFDYTPQLRRDSQARWTKWTVAELLTQTSGFPCRTLDGPFEQELDRHVRSGAVRLTPVELPYVETWSIPAELLSPFQPPEEHARLSYVVAEWFRLNGFEPRARAPYRAGVSDVSDAKERLFAEVGHTTAMKILSAIENVGARVLFVPFRWELARHEPDYPVGFMFENVSIPPRDLYKNNAAAGLL